MSAGQAVVADVRGMNRAQAVLVSRRCALLAVCLPTHREVGLSRKQENQETKPHTWSVLY